MKTPKEMNHCSIVTVGNPPISQHLTQAYEGHIYAADDLTEVRDMMQTMKPELILINGRCTPDQLPQFIHTTLSQSKTSIMVIDDPDSTTVTATSSSLESLKASIHNVIPVDHIGDHLNTIVHNLNRRRRPTDEPIDRPDFFVNDLAGAVSMAGRSEAMQHTLHMIQLVAASQCNPILLVGETGTGKELAARAIHHHRHPDKPFVAVNCAALTPTLLESELFGHVKGSFTGADQEKTGLLELAASGTVFLDEISEMSLDMQSKLLRVIQERAFRKVGSTREMPCRATIVASTNRDLKVETQENRFRYDLYYRLNVFPITLLPLRCPQRQADIALLTEYFIRTSCICPDKNHRLNSISTLAMEQLLNHNWPGNVRELRNVIERAILLETTDKIGLDSIVIDAEMSLQMCTHARQDKAKDFSLEKAEKELIARALQETNWQKTKAAELLGISRATLYAKVKQHSIESSANESVESHDDISPAASAAESPVMVA